MALTNRQFRYATVADSRPTRVTGGKKPLDILQLQAVSRMDEVGF